MRFRRTCGNGKHGAATHAKIFRDLWQRREIRRVIEIDTGVRISETERAELSTPRSTKHRQNPTQQKGDCHA